MEKEQFITEVLPYRPQLINFARRYVKNEEDAEDIVQEALLKLWYIRDTLDRYNNIYALSVQITKYLCINHLRANKNNLSLEGEMKVVGDIPAPDEKLAQKDDIKQIMQIITRLPDLQQSILRMKHIDGLEVDEIAELTGCNPTAIHTNLSRARKRVKEMFFKMQGL